MEKTIITNNALETIVLHACLGVDGIYGMWKGFKSFIPFLKRKDLRPHGIEIEKNGHILKISVFIIVMPDYDLVKLGKNIKSSVKREIETTTPFKVSEINVNIADIKKNYEKR